MTLIQRIITILVVVIGTALTRFLPFLIFPEGKTPPKFITYLGTVLPFAVIAMLIVYCLKDSLSSGQNLVPQMIAILFTFVLYKWKKNMLLGIGGGTVMYMLLVQYIFR
jgi:branched-subunit amino acid transport protein AzlD